MSPRVSGTFPRNMERVTLNLNMHEYGFVSETYPDTGQHPTENLKVV